MSRRNAATDAKTLGFAFADQVEAARSGDLPEMDMRAALLCQHQVA